MSRPNPVAKTAGKNAHGLCVAIQKYAKSLGLDISAGISADAKKLRIVDGNTQFEVTMSDPISDAKEVEKFIRQQARRVLVDKP